MTNARIEAVRDLCVALLDDADGDWVWDRLKSGRTLAAEALKLADEVEALREAILVVVENAYPLPPQYDGDFRIPRRRLSALAAAWQPGPDRV